MSGIDVVPESGVGSVDTAGSHHNVVPASDEAREQFLNTANDRGISPATREFLAKNPSTRDQLPPAGTPALTSEEINQTPTAELSSVVKPPEITTPVIANEPVITPAPLLETAAAPQTVELGEKKFTEFTLEDWKNYIEQNNLKTIKLGKNTTVFPFPNQDGDYIAVTSDLSIGVIEIKHDDLNMLKVALEARLKETEVADPVFDVYRRSRETVQKDDALGRYFLAIVEGSYDSPLITRHPVEPVSDNKIISDTLNINKAKSTEEATTPIAASAAR